MSSTMLPVDSRIFNNRNIQKGSYYHKCVGKDLISAIHDPLQQMGYHLSYEGVYKRFAHAIGVDTPWHHVKHLGTKKCTLDHHLKFNTFGYVPPRCMECWKVVVEPRTLKELFALLDIEKSLNRPAKCGIEIRYYTPRFYGGYFYNNSLDGGRECAEVVRKAVDEHIGKDVDVILKRGCTEYEMIKGPSAGWIMTDDDHNIDEKLEVLIDTFSPNTTGQTDACLAQVHTHWMEWAWKNKDPDVSEYIGDIPLYPETMTYHEGDINEIKADIIRAKAKVKHNIDPDAVDAVHAALRGFNMTKRIDFSKMGTILGFESMNPLFCGEGDTDNG